MIIGRFKIQCRHDRSEDVAAAIAAVEAPSRALPGVIHFDVSRSVTQPDTFLATEVFADRDAFDRQNAQPEVAHLLALLQGDTLVGELEWAMWEASPTT